MINPGGKYDVKELLEENTGEYLYMCIDFLNRT